MEGRAHVVPAPARTVLKFLSYSPRPLSYLNRLTEYPRASTPAWNGLIVRCHACCGQRIQREVYVRVHFRMPVNFCLCLACTQTSLDARFDSETVFSPDCSVAASSSSCFPSSLHLGPRDPCLEMRLAVRLAAIRIRLVIRLCTDALPSASTM